MMCFFPAAAQNIDGILVLCYRRVSTQASGLLRPMLGVSKVAAPTLTVQVKHCPPTLYHTLAWQAIPRSNLPYALANLLRYQHNRRAKSPRRTGTAISIVPRYFAKGSLFSLVIASSWDVAGISRIHHDPSW